ncbi:MAG: hypothetical protein Q8M64_12475, partial [Methyloversatilis sp.]|nr:hypothetical protein [Methyloversatilis sp.]
MCFNFVDSQQPEKKEFFNKKIAGTELAAVDSRKPTASGASMKYALNSVAALVALASTAAFAAPITPSSTALQTLSAATFGGSGIPNTAVQALAVDPTMADVTIGLTAHQRFTGPNLVNNGTSTFEASTGVSANPPS